MRKMTVLQASALLFSIACGVSCGGPPEPATSPGGPTPPASSENTPQTSPSAPAKDVWELPPKPAAEAPKPPAGNLSLDVWKKGAAAKGVPAPPARCAAFAKRAPAKPAPADVGAALGETDVAKRDAALTAVEADDDKKMPGRSRALRADLGPLECADAIADGWLAGKTSVDGDVGHLVVGLSLAGKLSRTALDPPKMPGGGDKAKVAAFVKGPLKTWVVEQATAIETLSSGAAGLVGYGRAVAAIEAGNADLRLVDNIRSAPVPKEWDAELKQVYEASLDEALEPRKARGRDAALTGLAGFADLGAIRDARVDRARTILSKLYGGRRIDALDKLWMPFGVASVAAEWALATHTQRLNAMKSGQRVFLDAPKPGVTPGNATHLGAFWASIGPARNVWIDGAISKTDSGSFATERIEIGRTYWRRADFIEAAYAAKSAGDVPQARIVLALALALAHGPTSASEMMRVASPAALDLGHTEALDAVAAAPGPYAGMAAFDAAYLRWLCPPQDDGASAWLTDVAARFHKAESMLDDPEQKKIAGERARDAEAAAQATGKK
jgi:hypothetical protein